MSIFRPLASLVWLENEVTDGQTDGPFLPQTLNKNGANHNDFSKLHPSLCSGGIKFQKSKSGYIYPARKVRHEFGKTV